MSRIHQLIEDEGHDLSAARCGMWATMLLAFVTVGIDIARTTNHVPNTVYGLEATMFMAFCGWAGGARIAQYLMPQIGAAVQALGSAARDARLPSKHDDERDATQ